MTPKEARAWVARWELVNAAERRELRVTPLAVKFRQLAALMASVGPLGWTEALAEEDSGSAGTLVTFEESLRCLNRISWPPFKRAHAIW